MKIAIVNLAPDSGHIIPLFKIANIFMAKGVSVKYFGPDETQSLAKDYKIEAAFVGTIRPSNHQETLTTFSRATPLLKSLITAKWFYINYFEKVIFNGLQKAGALQSLTENYTPDLILCDSHLFATTYKKLAKSLNVPIIINDAMGSYFNHQVSSLHRDEHFGIIGNAIVKFLKPIFGKCYAISNRVFSPDSFKKNEQINQYISNYWNLCLSEDLDALKTLNVSMGLGALEKKYLAEKISIPDEIMQLGPLPIVNTGELANELESWLGDVKPIIYIGFGTMVKGKFAFATAIVNAAQQLGYRILWAHHQQPWCDAIKQNINIRWEPWIPQTKILSHPNVKLFITHAGSGATQEALWFGKPMICIPFLWDQPYNAWIIKQLGCGLIANRSNITEKSMMRDITNALSLMPRVKEISNEFRNIECSESIYSSIIGYLSEYVTDIAQKP